jgi:CTP:molybdopterin cytidylyltransferase MocA
MPRPYETSLAGVATTTGLVLAGGASSRMGSPKALLEMPDGLPLAVHQCRLLRRAGCLRTAVVLGADAERIAPQLPGCEIIVNRDWQRGRFTSLQAGLRGVPPTEGYLILPVDSVGIQEDTLSAMISTATNGPFEALRPVVNGEPGRVLWINLAIARELIRQAPGDLRIDDHLRDRVFSLAVTDEAIVRNINTPAEWDMLRSALR